MTARRPPPRRTGNGARPPDLRRVWLLNGALAVLTIGLLAGPLRGLGGIEGMPRLPWWLIAAGFAGAETFVGHLQLRREAHTFSLSETALVIGLFTLPPA